MFCGCGCGQITPVAKRNRRDLGHVRGEHVRFVRGHRPGIAVGYLVEDRGHETPCWIWRGVMVGGGYGRCTRGGVKRLAHVALWEEVHGSVPVGLTLDHLCRVRACVNPAHLEPVTHAENCRRGHATKLTLGEAKEIKASGAVGRSLAARFGVSIATVNAIRAGRLWRDLDEAAA